MLKIKDLVPKVYNNQSRDFQLIGRLYDLVMNSVKTNSDLIYNCPLNANTDTQLMDLIALTLGFKSKHNYNIKQLTALCNSFAVIIREKGTLKSIIDACNALITSEGLTQQLEYALNEDNTAITLYIPSDLSDINLLKDLLIYILPAGMCCTIIKEQHENYTAATTIGITQTAKPYKVIKEKATLGILTQEELKEAFGENKGTILRGTSGVLENNALVELPLDKSKY